jgi:hypothetical protein
MADEKIPSNETIPSKQATPFKSVEGEKKSKSAFWIIGALVVVIAVLALFLFRSKPEGPELSPQMKLMHDTVQKIQTLETSIQTKQNEVFTTLGEYKKKTGQDLSMITLANFSPEQKQVLEEKIKAEKDTSIRSLLQDIVDRNSEIKNLQEKVQELEALLPKPHVVEKGDNHYTIAMNFLVNEKGVEKEEALKLMERALLFEPLIPGFKVWNFYSEGEYGTFITQGTAPVSPNQVQRKTKQALVDAKDKAISERDKLASDIEQLEARRTELISQLDLLNQEKESQLAKIASLNTENEGLQTEINSVFYLVDKSGNLEKRGILKGGFLRSTKLQSVSPDEFKLSIDLRKLDKIVITAAELGISKIKGLSVYPGYYKKAIDYSVSIAVDKLTATVTILDLKKFRNERLVIAVE